MRLFENVNIDFISKRKIAYVISAILVIIGLVALIIGPKFSIDFTGGISIELDMTPAEGMEPLAIEDIREVLINEGITDVELQTVRGLDDQVFFLFRAQAGGTDAETITNLMRDRFPEYTEKPGFVRIQDEVGPRIGDELKGKAILAIIYSLIGIIIYIWWRFEFTFGLAAVIALFHDVLITVGIFFLTGREISLAIVAALLTIVGYSLNDTIVIFDRIREDMKVYRKETYASIINHSICETLSRTVITSLTTFIVVLSLYLFGGSVIRDFAFALMIGVIVGTYSSIFVASPIILELFGKKKDKKRTSKVVKPIKTKPVKGYVK